MLNHLVFFIGRTVKVIMLSKVYVIKLFITLLLSEWIKVCQSSAVCTWYHLLKVTICLSNKLDSPVFAERVHWRVYFWGVKSPVEVCQTVCELHVNVHYMLHQDRLWVMAHVYLGLLSVTAVSVWCLLKHWAIDSQSVGKWSSTLENNGISKCRL